LKNRIKVAITGGGTGGHLSVAKAVAIELNNMDIKCIFIGSKAGQDRAWFEDSNLFEEKFFLTSSGVVNKRGLSKVVSLLNIISLSKEASSIIKNQNIDVVFSVGGFSSAPASIAALLSKKPLFIHEQNSRSGSLNRVLKPFAKEFFSSYHASSKLKNYPLRDEFFDNYRFREGVKTVGFFGGSQGAKFINNLALSLAPLLAQKGLAIVHQCGVNDYDRVAREYEKVGVNAELYGFYEKPWELFSKVDFAFSRSGAGMLWELCAAGVPAIFIPYPYAASDHQFYNARFLEELGACKVIREDEIDKDEILKFLDKGVSDLSLNLKDKIARGGAMEIARFITGSQDF